MIAAARCHLALMLSSTGAYHDDVSSIPRSISHSKSSGVSAIPTLAPWQPSNCPHSLTQSHSSKVASRSLSQIVNRALCLGLLWSEPRDPPQGRFNPFSGNTAVSSMTEMPVQSRPPSRGIRQAFPIHPDGTCSKPTGSWSRPDG